jgi:hypothetical protein
MAARVEEVIPSLQLCPFCGCPAEVVRFADGAAQARCTDRKTCGAAGPRLKAGAAEAAARWNRRFWPAAVEQGVEGLRPGAVVRPFHNRNQRILVTAVRGYEFVGVTLSTRTGMEPREYTMRNDRALFRIVDFVDAAAGSEGE